jgi:uncharacterized RDD family membrane protein YckC
MSGKASQRRQGNFFCMKSNFESDGAYRPAQDAAWIDPEAYDASEQQFAASLGANLDEPTSGPSAEAESAAEAESSIGNNKEADMPRFHTENAAFADPQAGKAVDLISPSALPSNPDGWREEVAARLTNYRARRRPREPRYPSLQLKFEASEPAWSNPQPSREARFHGAHPALTGNSAAAQVESYGLPIKRVQAESASPISPAESTARVIPFRRSAVVPPKPLEELAEPLQLFPRILEVPEVVPPLPALGGILIEPAPEEPSPKRPGIEIPLQTSRISRRLLAVGIDAMVVVSALSLFAYICFRITATIPPLKQFAEIAALIFGTFWGGYQYLLLTYSGTTPGLWLAKLRLSQFDGEPIPRQARRRRVFASIFLSGLSLGLGYAWCLLDEDQLCWHDRITRTHLAPKH